MNILDYLIIAVLIISLLVGFKKGVLNCLVTFIGTLAVIVLAFYLKNPVSIFLYNNLPFFDLGGNYSGISVYNILLYEGLSYVLTLFILSIIAGIIIKVTGVFNKLVNATIILGIPSKILGAICGFIEGYILMFLVVFLLSIIVPSSSLYNNSKYADTLMTKTPVLSNVISKPYKAFTEIYEITKKYATSKDKTAANLEALSSLLKYEIISVDNAQKLVDKGKIDFEGAQDIINIYRK